MVRQYSIALATLAVALFTRWLLDPICENHLAFVTLYVALAITAWYGGLGPTLLVTILGGLAAAYAFIPPRGSLEIALPLHRFQATYYLIAGIVIGLFGETARAATRRAEAKAEETRQKQLELAAEIAVRKELELQLQQRNKELQLANVNKDRFMAFLGHELRNPLTALHATLETLHHKPSEEGRFELHLQLMARQAHSLSRMVEDLLDVARITRGVVDLRSQPVEAVQAVRDAVDSVRPIVEVRRHELTVLPADGEVWIDADPIRLEQILSNLLHNAAKYTEPGGTISIGAAREGREAVLRVRDTGRGIAQRDLRRLFEPFVQLDPASDGAQGGMGLGLALVKKLVQMHGGNIVAFSDGCREKAASSWSACRWGRKRRPTRWRRRDTRPPAHPPRWTTMKTSPASMGELLTHLGYQVRIAGDGEEALRMAEEFLPTPCCWTSDFRHGRLRGCPPIASRTPVCARLARALTGYGVDGDEARPPARGGVRPSAHQPSSPLWMSSKSFGRRTRVTRRIPTNLRASQLLA